jgi:hypothetical protein
MQASQLTGRWRIDPTDAKSLQMYGDVQIEFRPDGALIYTEHSARDKKSNVILLTYRLDGEWLITNQPSAPREERTKVESLSKDVLVLSYGEQRTKYLRV